MGVSGSPNRYIFNTPRSNAGSVTTISTVDTTEIRIKEIVIRRDADLGPTLRVTFDEGIVEDNLFKNVGGSRSEIFSGPALANQLDSAPTDPTRSRWEELEATIFFFLRSQGKIPNGTYTIA